MNIRPIEMIDEMVRVLREDYGVDVMSRTRSDEVVIPRAALFNVCRGYYSATTLGKYFRKNHATILHHYRNHATNMMLPQYHAVYCNLQDVLDEFNELATASRRVTLENQIEELRVELKALRKQIQRNEETNSQEGAHDLRASVHRRTEVGDHQHDHRGEQHPVE